MKRIVSVLLTGSLLMAGSLAFASTEKPAPIETKKAEIKAKIESMQQSFSGLVTKTEKGLVLETAEGKYLLEGLSLDEIIGKEVFVTGVVENKKDANVIYVVKADLKE